MCTYNPFWIGLSLQRRETVQYCLFICGGLLLRLALVLPRFRDSPLAVAGPRSIPFGGYQRPFELHRSCFVITSGVRSIQIVRRTHSVCAFLSVILLPLGRAAAFYIIPISYPRRTLFHATAVPCRHNGTSPPRSPLSADPRFAFLFDTLTNLNSRDYRTSIKFSRYPAFQEYITPFFLPTTRVTYVAETDDICSHSTLANVRQKPV